MLGVLGALGMNAPKGSIHHSSGQPLAAAEFKRWTSQAGAFAILTILQEWGRRVDWDMTEWYRFLTIIGEDV